jgi:hypothetical protein
VEEGLLSAAREDIERLRQALHTGRREQRLCVECVVCIEPCQTSQGLRCGAESHFTCAGCVDQRTRIEAVGAVGARGGVSCCGFRCGALYEEQALAVHCTPESYALYQQAKVQGVQAAAEQAVVERLEAERLRLAALSEAD